MQFQWSSSVALIVIITLTSIQNVLCLTSANNVSVLVSLQLHPLTGPRRSWERGLEILPGALLAVSDINNDSTILDGYNLELVIVDSGKDETKVVQQFLNLKFHQEMHANLNIVGVTGILDPEAASLLIPLTRYKGVLVKAITHTDLLDAPLSSKAFHSLPRPSAVVSALFYFMREMNWKRIGLITESSDAYYFSIAETLLSHVTNSNESIVISPYIEVSHVTSAIRKIVKLKTRIIVVSLDAEWSIKLLCAAWEAGLVWPEYAWIFHGFQAEDLLTEKRSKCDIKDAVNGIFVIEDEPQSDLSHSEELSRITFSKYYERYLSSLSETALKYKVALKPNGYATLLYDLVWTMAFTLNKSSCFQNYQKHSEDTCTMHDKQALALDYQFNNNWTFEIFHVEKLQPLLISTVHYCNSSITAVSFNRSILGRAPSGELPLATAAPPLAYTVILGIQIILTTIYVTIVLTLYIIFRKEAEIRATSFTLSLFMFAGCYFNLLFLFLLFYSNYVADTTDVIGDNALCLAYQWLSASGISLPMILATLLVKMLRVYHIFNKTKRRLNRYCTDLSLALYVFLILVPNILVNFIWTLVDRYEINYSYEIKDGYIHLRKLCGSSNFRLLFGILVVYLLVLTLALAIVAITMRRVRRQHFKDTKKVNILLYALNILIVTVFSYWLLFRILDTKHYVLTLPLHIGHSAMIVLVLSLLFVPKVLPPLWRRIKGTTGVSW